MLLNLNLNCQIVNSSPDIYIQEFSINQVTYLQIDKTKWCDVSIIHNKNVICFYLAIEAVNYIQISSLDFSSEESAMILQSLNLEYGILDSIRTDHKNNTVFCHSKISRHDLARLFMTRITTL